MNTVNMLQSDVISWLIHDSENISSGGEVILLNRWEVITPEAEAMLQALHSRSVGWLRWHLEVLAKKWAEKFMESFYVWYGHKSIGDCGTITLFIEGVSMLTAKAIQDSPLYSGQEASTRYIDFSKQAFLLPVGMDESIAKKSQVILEEYRAYYLKALDSTINDLKIRFPQWDAVEGVWEKAIKARAFDICRWLLPCGASTNLAWHTNLRQAADKLQELRHHPIQEVREVGAAIDKLLKRAYPSSFHHKLYPATEAYIEKCMSEYYLCDSKLSDKPLLDTSGLRLDLFDSYEILRNRPEKTELPKYLAKLGWLSADYLLDFGSYRDVQRHRAISQTMPRVTFDRGFHPWYFEELNPSLRDETVQFLEKQKQATMALGLDENQIQNLIPMGYRVSCHFDGPLPAVVYMLELRSTKFVHPTLQEVAQQLWAQLQDEVGDKMVLHLSKELGVFDVKRGQHDIVQK
jgi:thymidylate synthase ThyX